MRYLILDPTSGAILGTGAAPDMADAVASTGGLGLCLDLADLPFEPDPARHLVVDGQIVDRPPPDPVAGLAAARAAGLASIARAAEVERAALLPMRDILRERDAVSWLAASDPDLADYPLIAAEVGHTAPTGQQVAQIILHDMAARAPHLARLERWVQDADQALAAADDAAAIPSLVAAALAAYSYFAEDPA